MATDWRALVESMTHEVPHVEGTPCHGRILRRIVEVRIETHTRPPRRVVTLNCGHEVSVPRNIRPTVGKLTGCPQCK